MSGNTQVFGTMDDQFGFSDDEDTRRREVRVASKEALRASGQVQSLSRALKLLNALSWQAGGLTLSEVAREVGLPTSTAHRLLTTLQNERFVRFDSERAVWLIGVQAFRVGAAFIRARDIASAARPYMRRLMERSGETVNLGIVDRGEVIYLAQVECHKMMRAITGPGGRAPLHCSGIGKAILSAMPWADAERILASTELRRETPHTLSDLASLKSDLAAAAARGYAIDNEENAIGLRCVASVIYDENAEPLAAISVSGPGVRISESRIANLGQAVAAAAHEIMGEIGGRSRPA